MNYCMHYYIQCSLDNKDTFIMRTFFNVPIGKNLYKSTSEESEMRKEDTFVLRTGSVGPMVSLIKRLHCTCIKDR